MQKPKTSIDLHQIAKLFSSSPGSNLLLRQSVRKSFKKVSFSNVFVAGKKWDFFGNFSNSVCNSEKFLLYLNYIAWCDLYLCREIRMKVFSSAFSCVCVAQKREHQWGRGEERKSSCMMDALFDIINWITHTLLSFEVTFINCEKWTSHLKIFHVLLFL